MYVITNQKATEFWNNEEGWVDLLSADKFTKAEREGLNLPVEGRWVSLWELKMLQWARLIAECEACGIFSDEERMMQVADSMDLELDEIYTVISDAQEYFDTFKTTI